MDQLTSLGCTTLYVLFMTRVSVSYISHISYCHQCVLNITMYNDHKHVILLCLTLLGMIMMLLLLLLLLFSWCCCCHFVLSSCFVVLLRCCIVVLLWFCRLLGCCWIEDESSMMLSHVASKMSDCSTFFLCWTLLLLWFYDHRSLSSQPPSFVCLLCGDPRGK